jgi:transposase InsO family protein
MELVGLRADAGFAMEQFAMSERRACKRYEPRSARNAALRERLMQLARRKPRYGYRRLHALLCRQGHAVSPQRVYRVYREQGCREFQWQTKRRMFKRQLVPQLGRGQGQSRPLAPGVQR